MSLFSKDAVAVGGCFCFWVNIMPWKRVVSKGPYGNHVLNDHREAIICRDDKSVKRFKPGDIAWIKVRDCCWWPWQVYCMVRDL